MSFLPSYVYFIVLSFLASLIIYSRRTRIYAYFKLFPPFLLLTLAVESYGSYLSFKGQDNVIIYNFFSIFEFCFYFFFIRSIIKSEKVKKILLITALLYALLACINIVFVLKIKSFHITSYVIGCLLITIACVYYFFELLRFPRVSKLHYNPTFWICTGILFFYCCSFPLYGLLNYWNGISKLVLNNFMQIASVINIFLYSLFTIGFLCIRTRKYTLSP